MAVTESCSVQLLKGDMVFRAYIGLMWFFAPGQDVTEALATLQRGVDAIVAHVPALAGSVQGGRVQCGSVQGGHVQCGSVQGGSVAYVPGDSVQVQHDCVGVTFAEVAAANFDQNQFPDLFSRAPCADQEQAPALVVQLTSLKCGALRLMINCHHSLGDARAVSLVAKHISGACDSLGRYTVSPALWTSRPALQAMLDNCPLASTAPPVSEIGDCISRRPYSELSAMGDMRDFQVHLPSESLQQLKYLLGESTNNAVMALFWRAWARALVQHGSTCPWVYSGGPMDVSGQIGNGCSNTYLGNLIVPRPMRLDRSFVLDQSLAEVAAAIRQKFQKTKQTAAAQQFLNGQQAGEDQRISALGQTDSPMLAFSNMTRMEPPLHSLSFGMTKPLSVQLRSFGAPFMVFAMADGHNGILANTTLPNSIAHVLAKDPEFNQYANFKY
ncbi:hypothetical protein GGF46_005244 [Coemansia sp. RSA 552]|nr:hypothetical protein GGF46_005244 [Coemansia sp. RSA 552]